MGPNSLTVVYVDPLGNSVHSCSKVELVIAIETGFAEHIGGRSGIWDLGWVSA